ncbi:class I SAM-dependent methyltransferase [bacterium]|nr:class I SAM-dependent methyltransferase [bacterium]
MVETLELLDLSGATTLLDNGCGNGELSVQAARKFPDLRIFGYDALESAVVQARRRASELESSNLSFDSAWADDLPLPASSVDRALFRNVLHHIAQPRAVFTELARCLRTRGLLLLQTPYNNREGEFSDFLSEFHLLMDDSHRRFYYTLESIQGDLSHCGFSVNTSLSNAYPFPSVTERMKDLVLEHGFGDRLNLKQISEDTWSVTLYWTRLTAIKVGAQQVIDPNARPPEFN